MHHLTALHNSNKRKESATVCRFVAVVYILKYLLWQN